MVVTSWVTASLVVTSLAVTSWVVVTFVAIASLVAIGEVVASIDAIDITVLVSFSFFAVFATS